MFRIDHVIWMSKNLDASAARFADDFGLSVSGGGSHEGHGTFNRLVPLGQGFIELLAVEDEELAQRSPIGKATLAAREGLFGWVIAVDDVAAHAERLGISTLELRRGDLRIPLAGVEEAMESPWLPFFVERDPEAPDPGASGSAGGIATITIAGDPDELGRWLDGRELPVTVEPGDRGGVRAVTLGSGTTVT